MYTGIYKNAVPKPESLAFDNQDFRKFWTMEKEEDIDTKTGPPSPPT